MRLAICVAIKNRSCVIVDEEDSLSYLHHVHDKLTDCPNQKINPIFTKDKKIALLLMPKMLRSLLSQKKEEDDWVLVVVDYKSTDIDMKAMLEYEVGDKMPWHLESVEDYPHFDRGGGLAKAFQIAEVKFQAEAIFFCDADLQFTLRDVFDRAIESVSKGHFYYPIFYSFALSDHSKGLWRDTSFGNFACSVINYKKTEGWYHNISWGWEDRALADSIPEFLKDREQVPGFYHQWHPLKWEFRVKEYPMKEYLFRGAAVKELTLPKADF
jgi:glycosyltransferase involved in cell wall biosynthesis